jgi:hypothetical protein
MADPKRAFRSIDMREVENNISHAMQAFNRGSIDEAEGRLRHVLGKLAARGLEISWRRYAESEL